MILFNPSQPFSFNYPAFTQFDSLNVRASIYDISSGAPIFVENVVLTNIISGVYAGSYVGDQLSTYLVISAVYEDDTFTSFNSLYAPQADIYKSISAPITFCAFNYAFYSENPSSFVGANIYDSTAGTPVFNSQIEMTEVFAGVYLGIFTGTLNHVYDIVKLVYTDDTYTTVNLNYAPASESLSSFAIVQVINNFLSATLSGQNLEAVLSGQNLNAILVS